MRGGARSGETARCEPRRTARRLAKGPCATCVCGLGGGQLLVVVGLLHSLKTIYDECRSRPASRARVGDRERGRRACAAPGPQSYTHTRTRGWGTVGAGGVLALRGCRQVPSHVPRHVPNHVPSHISNHVPSHVPRHVSRHSPRHISSRAPTHVPIHAPRLSLRHVPRLQSLKGGSGAVTRAAAGRRSLLERERKGGGSGAKEGGRGGRE